MKTINLKGAVGWEIYPDQVQRMLFSAGGEDITVNVSSPGGYVIDGFEIFNMFKNYSGDVHFHIVGEASSIMSYIVMSGNKVTAESNAVMMIHNAGSWVRGDHNSMRKEADILEGLSNLIANAYAKKTGKPVKDVKAMMDSESWFFGSGIVDAGLIDEIVQDEATETEPMEESSAIALAKQSFSACMSKMKAEGKAEDFEKAAAMLRTPITAHNTRVEADNKKEIIMNLEKVMAENPGVKAEVEALKTAQYNAGIQAGKEAIEARITKASPFMASAEYPEPIRALAAKVITGESDHSALESAVAVYDMLKEQTKANAAAEETPADTKPENHKVSTSEGKVESEEDYQAHVAMLKKQYGMEG